MKRILSSILAIAMIVSLVPVVGFAETTVSADEVIASVFFASDYQFWGGDVPNNTSTLFGEEITSCKPVIERFAQIAKKNSYDIDGVVIGGDYSQNDGVRDASDPIQQEIFGESLQWHYGNNPNYSIAEIKTAMREKYPELTDDEFVLLQGNHEPDTDTPLGAQLTKTGPHEFEDYIVYVLNDQDYVGPRPRSASYDDQLSKDRIAIDPETDEPAIEKITDPKAVVTEVANDLKEYLNERIAKGDKRPVFICSHQPVHYVGGDYNGNGYLIYNAINEAAKELDIVYFFAHTHSDTDYTGGGLSYIERGGTMRVCNDTLGANAYEEKPINFTYMNYGFLARYVGENPYISASIVDITDDKLVINRYGVNLDAEPLRTYEIERVDPAKLLTAPMLQLPTEDSVKVVWFTEYQGGVNKVMLYENGTESEPSREIDAVTTKLSRIRTSAGKTRDVYRHEADVTGLPKYFDDSDKVSYRVKSDAAVSEFYKLQAMAQPGTDMKILLTSDSQLKDMTPANMQKIVEEFGEGEIDAVFFAGDLVNIPDLANEWFDDPKGGAFFPSMQGFANKTYPESKGTYTGGPILQYAPMYTAIGNHEVMGRHTGATPSSEFNVPAPTKYAEDLYNEKNSDEDASNNISEEDKADFIRDNSFNTITYEELFSLPTNDKGNERYYAETIGDVRLVVLEITRIWRGNTVGTASKYSEPVGVTGETNPQRQWGTHIFESIAEGSDQYKWLQSELASDEFKDAKYKVVMFHHQFHSLGGNVVPAYTDPVEKTVKTSDGKDIILYEYPLENDQMVGIEPLLEDAGVDLILNGHSHLWNRFVTEGGTNVLETSNVGNTYQAFLDIKSRTDSVPSAFAEGNAYNYLADEWDRDDYVMQGDPYGLSPVMPTLAPLYDNPYIESNTITAFSVFDTATGIIDSYYYNTDDTNSDIIHFDSFSIFKQDKEEFKAAKLVSSQDEIEQAAVAIACDSAKGIIFAADNTAKTIEVYKDSETPEHERTIELSGILGEAQIGNITGMDVDIYAERIAVSDDLGNIIVLNYSGEYISHAATGKQPAEMVFTGGGEYLLAANKDASVTKIDMTAEVLTAEIAECTVLDSKRAEMVAENIIIEKGKKPSEVFTATDIAVSGDGRKAFILLDGVNALMKYDAESGQITGVDGLGFKNNLLAGNEVDLTADGSVNPSWANTRSAYIPSDINVYEANGSIYVLTVNSGDVPDELMTTAEIRGSTVSVIDKTKADGLPAHNEYADMLGKTNDVNYLGGTASFSVFDASGEKLTQVYDSGSLSGIVNAEDVELKTVTTAKVGEKVYAYAATSDGIIVIDVTDPEAPVAYDYVEGASASALEITEAQYSATGYPRIFALSEDGSGIVVYQHEEGYVGNGSDNDDGSDKNDSSSTKPSNRPSGGGINSGHSSGGSSSTVTSSNIIFDDVKTTDWFYNPVQYVCKKGLFKGVSDTMFEPDSPMTRGMIVTVLARVENVNAPATEVFADVALDAYYAKAVTWANENRVVLGYGDGTFKPELNVSREDFAVMLFRYARMKGYDVSFADSVGGFADSGEISDYASDAVNWAVYNGLLNGKGNNILDPLGNLTRAEAAAIIERFCEL